LLFLTLSFFLVTFFFAIVMFFGFFLLVVMQLFGFLAARMAGGNVFNCPGVFFQVPDQIVVGQRTIGSLEGLADNIKPARLGSTIITVVLLLRRQVVATISICLHIFVCAARRKARIIGLDAGSIIKRRRIEVCYQTAVVVGLHGSRRHLGRYI